MSHKIKHLGIKDKAYRCTLFSAYDKIIFSFSVYIEEVWDESNISVHHILFINFPCDYRDLWYV